MGGIQRRFVQGGTLLVKLWMEVGNDEQKRRFEARITDPLRQWKLSPMDLPSRKRRYDYSRARDLMLEKTDTRSLPGTSSVRTTNARRASTPSPICWRRFHTKNCHTKK